MIENITYPSAFLSVLYAECKYFLNKEITEKQLYFKSVTEQIKNMKLLLNRIEPVPQWISLIDIKKIETKMKRITKY